MSATAGPALPLPLALALALTPKLIPLAEAEAEVEEAMGSTLLSDGEPTEPEAEAGSREAEVVVAVVNSFPIATDALPTEDREELEPVRR